MNESGEVSSILEHTKLLIFALQFDTLLFFMLITFVYAAVFSVVISSRDTTHHEVIYAIICKGNQQSNYTVLWHKLSMPAFR
jgi:hypothetical protein